MDILGIGNMIVGLVQGHQERKARKAELEQAIHLKRLEGVEKADAAEFQADERRAESLQNSWKDEYITLVISIPLFLCFAGPGGAARVEAGFSALERTPDWYQYMVVAVFLVGAGVPLAGKATATIKKILG